MPRSLPPLAPAEMAALDRIREDKPEVLLGFSEWLADVLDDLAISSQGRLVSEADVDALLRELQDELVRRIMAEGNSWREDEDLRGPTVDLLVRHLLVEARGLFVRRVVGAKWN